MPKRKTPDGDGCAGRGNTVPIAIQTFFWRQTSHFIKPKMTKLCEGTCVTFERVLVQNILHGLSPSLCEAIQSVSRWKVIQAAFPHVIHCCAALLNERKANSPDGRFNLNETKMLYTLHWIILDAASECEDIENDNNSTGKSLYSYLHSLDVIQLFIYLFAPLIDTLKEGNFQSLKLENGLRLWQPLWDFRQPDVPCYSTPVKAKRIVLKAQRNLMKVNFNMANIYIGKGTSNENIYLGPDDLPSPGGSVEASTPKAPIARLSDICALSTTATETSVEIVCEICNETLQAKNGEMSCKCGVRRSSFVSFPENKVLDLPQGLASPVDKEYMTKRLESVVVTGVRSVPNPDVLSASYFDVAVLRCLFCPQWAEDGVYWALRYIHQRLLEVHEEINRVEYSRERSHSLPVPEVQITPPDEHPVTPATPDSPERPTKLLPLNTQFLRDQEHRKEPSSKRMRVAEIKHIIGDKVKQLRRRESVEQFDLDSTSPSANSKTLKEELTEPVSPSEHLKTSEGEQSRPSSALGKLSETEQEDSYEEDQESGDSASDIVRRKSMPALRRHKKNIVEEEEEDDDDSSGSGGKPPSGVGPRVNVMRAGSLKPELLQKPIITITHDSPEPSPINTAWNPAPKRDSLSSEKSDAPQKPTPLQRSFTDSNIDYNRTEEIEEVPGSLYYIQANGQLNYGVILHAMHAVSGRDCSSRICGVILNTLNCLLDLGIIEKKENNNNNNKKANADKNKTNGKQSKKKKVPTATLR